MITEQIFILIPTAFVIGIMCRVGMTIKTKIY